MAEEEDEDNSDSLAEADVRAGASKGTGVEIAVSPVGGSTRGNHGELMADGGRWVRIATSRLTKNRTRPGATWMRWWLVQRNVCRLLRDMLVGVTSR